MSTIEVALVGGGACRIVHSDSGAEIRSSKAPEYGGAGGAFSSTDLLAAALGSCIATNLEPVAERHGVPLDALRLSVEKRLSVAPKRIEALDVRIAVGGEVAPSVLTRLERAAQLCLVHDSLSREIDVTIDLVGTGVRS